MPTFFLKTIQSRAKPISFPQHTRPLLRQPHSSSQRRGLDKRASRNYIKTTKLACCGFSEKTSASLLKLTRDTPGCFGEALGGEKAWSSPQAKF
ncbi:hypothetical protein A2833_01320 [Candidatus Azambacteria bacterium RIFCSPHIGHO2_01_FULL_44_55]|uniref:Uncharacterized protein n=1 Tax=Candidatus Azambacteria bacterium RIFCSPLOWO2_02_FULL_44_14 TaxID=1797306 RepID=A0A1F5C9R6_9BACT|nr:MAG: hypothetical protein A3A18_01890 [Candidatus Azambacteria bacterium RIFCSPLOWO2_01_FULL_44_84]OGD33146.1 MAG: hypothetical protein A3C78_02700 [Candidatus Azambacteria bacterium RIFCSPHIGHO2_02_FULL_45_18]OGD39609.1 MAG: hypothetical protein A3I30_03860 [Candidatus Azambacteria bacterium RIFCSPLOWO2_02_FULL_44_14]OGD39934.1 MAG: hypothetical protein A2833_01320 [Candidatus Azambacteria bacterium RIFCSPHIGHO2_01_FULL_44_55]